MARLKLKSLEQTCLQFPEQWNGIGEGGEMVYARARDDVRVEFAGVVVAERDQGITAFDLLLTVCDVSDVLPGVSSSLDLDLHNVRLGVEAAREAGRGAVTLSVAKAAEIFAALHEANVRVFRAEHGGLSPMQVILARVPIEPT